MEKEISDIDIQLFLEELSNKGYDFTGYSITSLKRRLNRLLLIESFSDFEEFKTRLNNNPGYLKHIVQEITVNVTEMFRDPYFYKSVRLKVLPLLANQPLIKIWHAGCSTGEEVYSMAILLKEANLLRKSLIYATDINPKVLDSLRKGIFPMSRLKQFSENYIMSGGVKDFSSYYTAKYDWAKFDEELKHKMIVSTHNLVSDKSFNVFQLIICRNVLIYFDKDLQNSVFQLFDQSLEPSGFLCLGSRETLKYSSVAEKFEQFESREKIWRKRFNLSFASH